MKLSIADAATVLGQTQRQVRYLIKTGRIVAVKVGGRWRIDSDRLPLSESQRRALASRLDAARSALEKGLAPATQATEKEEKPPRQYSVTDLFAFQTGAEIFRNATRDIGSEDPACQRLAAALALVAQGCHSFHPNDKAERFAAARDLLAAVTAELLLGSGDLFEKRQAVADRIEQELIPKVGRLVAAQEKRSRRSRFDRFGSFASQSG